MSLLQTIINYKFGNSCKAIIMYVIHTPNNNNYIEIYLKEEIESHKPLEI